MSKLRRFQNKILKYEGLLETNPNFLKRNIYFYLNDISSIQKNINQVIAFQESKLEKWCHEMGAIANASNFNMKIWIYPRQFIADFFYDKALYCLEDLKSLKIKANSIEHRFCQFNSFCPSYE